MAEYTDRDTGVASDSIGGTINPPLDQQSANPGAQAATDQSYGPSAGYGSNVDQTYPEPEQKKGFMSKVKDKLLPSGPGETRTGGDMTQNAASHAHHASHGGKELRSAQANADLNRE
ncbi:hypothetical protein EG329_002173 [Mollisiaceae sp. DMI_Dod_QoI]|nr:hypothetical protein EG329_002173 [Helotiales sp. DMI_Dod_QoI]